VFAIALLVLRYIFLLFLFIFIFRLVKWMVGDLRENGDPQPARLRAAGPRKEKGPGQEPGGRIIVVENSSPAPTPGDTFGIGGGITVGRGDGSDIIIKDSFASTRHARIYLREEQYWLEDLDSTNGTFLNGVWVKQPIVLANGDRIRIGGITFQFVRWGYEVGSDN